MDRIFQFNTQQTTNPSISPTHSNPFFSVFVFSLHFSLNRINKLHHLGINGTQNESSANSVAAQLHAGLLQPLSMHNLLAMAGIGQSNAAAASNQSLSNAQLNSAAAAQLCKYIDSSSKPSSLVSRHTSSPFLFDLTNFYCFILSCCSRCCVDVVFRNLFVHPLNPTKSRKIFHTNFCSCFDWYFRSKAKVLHTTMSFTNNPIRINSANLTCMGPYHHRPLRRKKLSR